MWLRSLALALGVAALGALQVEDGRIYHPEGVNEPDWLEPRRKAQLATASSLGVFHDFRFHDRVEESGITFRNQVTEDSSRHYKAIHYDHGNGVAVADVDSDGKLDVFFTNQTAAN